MKFVIFAAFNVAPRPYTPVTQGKKTFDLLIKV